MDANRARDIMRIGSWFQDRVVEPQTETERQIQSALDIINNAVKCAAFQGRDSVTVQFHSSDIGHPDQLHWLGECKVLWSNGYKTITDIGLELLQRISSKHFQADVGKYGITLYWRD